MGNEFDEFLLIDGFPRREYREWPYGDPTANAEENARYPEPDSSTSYCGVALVGGWCKRPRGHEGGHACS